MRVNDVHIAELREQGYTIVPGFLNATALAEARAALWSMFPEPGDYFAAPATYQHLAGSALAGNLKFPFKGWALNRLCVDPDLIDFAERFLEAEDIELYKAEIWAKYAGAANYNQAMHRDFYNHDLVVPRAAGRDPQMTTFLLLSDVTAADAPTKLLPLTMTRSVPLSRMSLPVGFNTEGEVAVTGPAGTLMAYRTDVFHRGSDFAGPGRARFTILTDFQRRGLPWRGKMSWPDRALQEYMRDALTRMTPRQRDLFGWPRRGDPYWCDQTLTDVQNRYPKMDLTPYRKG